MSVLKFEHEQGQCLAEIDLVLCSVIRLSSQWFLAGVSRSNSFQKDNSDFLSGSLSKDRNCDRDEKQP